ncbi:hypothetical protein RvY_04580-3 [Ramazzottius varieornatus]|uniref:Receptor ligand binding region domain-containing protein n=1 Tax=Ramazzottius varieornatus TaxID=947166 RepID=A0A1D1UYS9_RAMVA|nr:hypothetical protein RvY_04580-3 [Ramazzottius varieornatus]
MFRTLGRQNPYATLYCLFVFIRLLQVFLGATTGSAIPAKLSLTWPWEFNEDKNETALEAFRHLIMYNNVDPDWKKIPNWLEEIPAAARAHFSTNFSEDQKYNELVISAYEMMLATGQVLRETMGNVELSGRSFAAHFWNRTFEFPSRKFTMGPYGMRVVDVLFSRPNLSARYLEEVWRYDAATRLLNASAVLGAVWPSSTGRAPPDRPACGYNGELCDTPSGVLPVDSRSMVGIAIAIGFFVLWTVYLVRNRYGKYDADNPWWSINAEDLVFFNMMFKLQVASSLQMCLLLNENVNCA